MIFKRLWRNDIIIKPILTEFGLRRVFLTWKKVFSEVIYQQISNYMNDFLKIMKKWHYNKTYSDRIWSEKGFSDLKEFALLDGFWILLYVK